MRDGIMSGAKLKAFIVKVRITETASETFYILAHDINQARLRAYDLSRMKIAPDTVAAA